MLTLSPNDLITITDGVQANIFSRILEKVILPHSELAISSPIGLNNHTLVLTGRMHDEICIIDPRAFSATARQAVLINFINE